MAKETETIRWHQGFRGGIKAVLWPYRNELEYDEEHVLNLDALKLDLLVLKKSPGVVIDNEIGRFFRMHNILEYKSPEDSLSIDDYYKTMAYVCLYKSLGEQVDAIPGEELTASIFRQTYPRELFKALKRLGATIKEEYSGVYYVSGLAPFPTQIVVSRQLEPDTFAILRAMSKDAADQDARALIRQSRDSVEPGLRNNLDAVLEVSVAANPILYETIRRDTTMCNALRELMKDDLVQERNAGVKDGALANQQEVAKRMIQKHMAFNLIMDLTDLPLSKIQEISDSLHMAQAGEAAT